jgi:hypothetical protein
VVGGGDVERPCAGGPPGEPQAGIADERLLVPPHAGVGGDVAIEQRRIDDEGLDREQASQRLAVNADSAVVRKRALISGLIARELGRSAPPAV